MNAQQREVMFFSKEVTHVITTRSIPPKSDRMASPESTSLPTNSLSLHGDTSRTIENILAIDKNDSLGKSSSRSKFNFEASVGRKPSPSSLSQSGVRKMTAQVDILQRAKDMSIKTWQREKLQRILDAILSGEDQQHGHNTRSQSTATQASKAQNEPTLEDVLREDAKKKTR